MDLRDEEDMYSMRGRHALADRFNGVGTKGRALTRCVTIGHSVSQCGRHLNCHTPHTLRHSYGTHDSIDRGSEVGQQLVTTIGP